MRRRTPFLPIQRKGDQSPRSEWSPSPASRERNSNRDGDLVGEGADTPGVGPGGERADQLVVDAVAGQLALETAEDRRAEHIQVADGVQRLVAGEISGAGKAAGRCRP